MKNILLVLFLPLFASATVSYPVNLIPEKLYENANAVVRLEKTSFKIKDAGSALLSNHIVVTILNERGAEMYEELETDYDKHTIVKEIKGYVYDQLGKEIFKLKKAEIIDVGLSAISTDISDSRKKIAPFNQKKFAYPYTIEFYNEVETKNMMFYPTAVFGGEEHLSKEEQILEILAPENFELRYKELNMVSHVQITVEDGIKKYLWKDNNIAAYIYEELRPLSTYPIVYTAPINFNVENYSGKIETWNDIALFYAKLNENRAQLSDDFRAKILKLISSEKDTLAIIHILYNYLQTNTRYVSIQLGIGGWQTATAQDVANKGYGDCKALSNFFMALLNVAGVKSHLALVKAGSVEDMFDIDFPRFNFNHIICCVPLKNDTIWFECTSQINAPGFLGSFTGNRKALLITHLGGEIVNTTKYNYSQNYTSRVGKINVNSALSATGLLSTTYAGIEQEKLAYVYHQLNRESQKKFIQENTNFAISEINDFSLKNISSTLPKMEEVLNLSIKGIFFQTGEIYLLRPHLFYKKSENLTILRNRNSPFYLSSNSFCKQEIDSIVFNFPIDFAPSFVPPPLFLDNKFGTYVAHFEFKEQGLLYYRKLILKAGLFNANEYKEWIDFNKKVDKFDRLEVAFNKK